MATIAVRVGREVKEISGLTKSTTCWDVVLALLKEQQQTAGTDSAAGATDKAASGERATEESASNSSTSKSIKELAGTHVIVENWRGCEKPIPPRTRILNVWEAWGKEQKHVELSLKKSKHIRYREGGRHRSRKREGKTGQRGDAADGHYSLHNMSSQQKRRIRRNMWQYQRAVMMKQNEDDDLTDDLQQGQSENDDSRRVLFDDKKQTNADGRSEKRNGLVLSEEKFIDGFLVDPERPIGGPDRASLINQGTFNRETCKYRRRNRRRHGSADSRQRRRRQVSHYPYSSQHDKRRSSRHRESSSKSPKYRFSTDDASTTTATTNTSQDEDAEDADDEKSVLIELSCPVIRRNHTFGVRGYGGSGTTTTATDSSTTTSGDSMTSSMGGSTTSDTSSGGDYFLPVLNRLSYGKAIENMKSEKDADNSSNKPKKNKSILGGFSKPAFNLIESFRKTNSKRKSAKKNIQAASKQETPTETARKDQHADGKTPETISPPKPVSTREKKSINATSTEKSDEEDTNSSSGLQANEFAEQKIAPTKISTKAGDEEQYDEVSQTVLSQGIVLKNQQNRLADIDGQIQKMESDIHAFRTRALGKNYVQDTYLSSSMQPDSNEFGTMDSIFSGSSIPVATPWILQCDDGDSLERFSQMSEKIVEMQLKLEECNRKAEILMQDMQEEVWRASPDSTRRGKGRNTVKKAAALMLGFSDDDDSTDDEEGHELLLVKNWKEGNPKAKVPNEHKTAQNSLHLELETSRTELEASLYLSLRLAAEIEEVEDKLGTSDHLVQKKGENLIQCIRDLTMSEEGIDPEVWEEYGRLLTAYDMEVQQRGYLESLDASCTGTEPWHEEEETLYIDATQPNPTSRCVNGHNQHRPMQPGPHSPALPPKDQSMVPSSPSLHQAAPSCTWCEHCKMEEQIIHSQTMASRKQQIYHPNVGAAVQPPTLFSNLPLPTPIDKSLPSVNPTAPPRTPSAITSGLLPMLPIPDGLMSPHQNDSDYEDLPDLTTMQQPEPSKSSRERCLLAENESSNNTDDSGNGSAGSTMSFASSDGSRNSSCDGGSPRPIPSISDVDLSSKQPFNRNNGLRGSWRERFVFPSNPKQNYYPHSQFSQSKSFALSKAPPPLPPRIKKPELSPKPSALSLKKAVSAVPKEQEILKQQQRLIRRNSGGRWKNSSGVIQPEASAGKDSQKLQNVSSNKLHPRESQRKTRNQIPSKIAQNDKNLRSNRNYDNDSDTGLSSLHSVDSDQVLFAETLV